MVYIVSIQLSVFSFQILRVQNYNIFSKYARKWKKIEVFCTKWWMKIWKFEKNVLSLQKI
mgnify:CR=1 FL=1